VSGILAEVFATKQAPSGQSPGFQKDPFMNFDFSRAALKHSSWKMQLRNFLDGKGGLTADQAISHRHCELGKWLYSEGLAKYGTLPEMKALEREHELLHQTVKAVMDLKIGGKVQQAEAAFLKVEPSSKRIVELLNILDKKSAA
jgi:methyl-accepting chemotaxis protein